MGMNGSEWLWNDGEVRVTMRLDELAIVSARGGRPFAIFEVRPFDRSTIRLFVRSFDRSTV